MQKFRKKPVVIEAVQLNRSNRDVVVDWMNEKDNVSRTVGLAGIEILTFEGIMTATRGDYIIKGVKGEFYPCKPDIFNETYEKVEE